MINHLTVPSRVHRMTPSILVLVLLAALVAGCGVESDSVETVDDAVTLLQDVERDGLWVTSRDGLDALAEQDGYVATLQLDYTMQDATDLSPASIELTLEVDADGDARYALGSDEENTRFFQFTHPSASADDTADFTGVYREDEGRYTCAADEIQRLLAQGVPGIFEMVQFDALAARTLAVVEADGDSTIAGRDANHYTIETRREDALAILERTDHRALREEIEEMAPFELSGTLDLDDASGALLHLDSTYTSTNDDQRLSLAFNVTQWGDVPDIQLPSPDNITACD